MTQGYENWTDRRLHERLRELLQRRAEAIVERDSRLASLHASEPPLDPRLRTLAEGDRRRAREAQGREPAATPAPPPSRVGRYSRTPGSREIPLMSVRDSALYERWTRNSGASHHGTEENPGEAPSGPEQTVTPRPAPPDLVPLESEIESIERSLEEVRRVLARRAELERVERFARLLAGLRSQIPRHSRQAHSFDVEAFIRRNTVQIRHARALALAVGRKFPDRERDFLSLPEQVREELLAKIFSL